MKARHRVKYHEHRVSVINLTDDEDELLELLNDGSSLRALAENDVKFRQAEINLIKTKLKKLRDSRGVIRVTDHALIRYLERVSRIDVEALRQELLSKVPISFNPETRDGFVDEVFDDGLRYVIRDNLVITITSLTDTDTSGNGMVTTDSRAQVVPSKSAKATPTETAIRIDELNRLVMSGNGNDVINTRLDQLSKERKS